MFIFVPPGNEKKVYELIVRHFLACVSQDAQGHETVVDIDIAGEKFTAQGNAMKILFMPSHNH